MNTKIENAIRSLEQLLNKTFGNIRCEFEMVHLGENSLRILVKRNITLHTSEQSYTIFIDWDELPNGDDLYDIIIQPLDEADFDLSRSQFLYSSAQELFFGKRQVIKQINLYSTQPTESKEPIPIAFCLIFDSGKILAFSFHNITDAKMMYVDWNEFKDSIRSSKSHPYKLYKALKV